MLVVDDNPDVTESLCELLQMLGHQARAAHDGPAALTVAAEFRPDLILLDLGLPGMSGQEVARRLRQQPGGGEVTIIALTGCGERSGVAWGRDAGFDGHVVKPAGLDVLRELAGVPVPACSRAP